MSFKDKRTDLISDWKEWFQVGELYALGVGKILSPDKRTIYMFLDIVEVDKERGIYDLVLIGPQAKKIVFPITNRRVSPEIIWEKMS